MLASFFGNDARFVSVLDHAAAWKHVKSVLSKLPISEWGWREVLGMNYRTVRRSLGDQAGRLRKGEIRVTGSLLVPPRAPELQGAANAFTEWLAQAGGQPPVEYHPLLLAADVHVKVYPLLARCSSIF